MADYGYGFREAVAAAHAAGMAEGRRVGLEEAATMRAQLETVKEALREVLSTQGALCQSECLASHRMVEIASGALAKLTAAT